MAPVGSPGLTTVQQGCNHYGTVDSDFRAQRPPSIVTAYQHVSRIFLLDGCYR